MNMKSYWMISFLCIVFACSMPQEEVSQRPSLSLAGTWHFQLDSLDQGKEKQWYKQVLAEQVILPGTTDTNQKGLVNTRHDETTQLSRPYYYKGKAWYQKEVDIPADWTGKQLVLTLERTKPTEVWVDSLFAGTSNNVTTPQQYDLSAYLAPGKHRLTILVDNAGGLPLQLLNGSHTFTESTQTNWNGIIGEITLEARPAFHIEQLRVTPHAAKRTTDVRIRFRNPEGQPRPVHLTLDLQAFNTAKKHRIHIEKDTIAGNNPLTFTVDMGKEALTWSEFDPALYRLTATVSDREIHDSQSTTFGLRDFQVQGTQFTINGLTTFLRGKHDACLFPLTAHTPMDTASWRRYFRIAKTYGINHCRFHSWCPPRACFEAADAEGIYLQPELPFWGGFNAADTALITYLKKEGLHILEAYGNHASFVMMALGNELSGDKATMEDFVRTFRTADGRPLYASGSNNFLGYQGALPGDDYFTTCRVPGENIRRNHTRGSFSFADADEGGYINATYPNSVMNFRSAVEQCPLPIIGHETGQFQCYPNYAELPKYTGVLKPWNLERFRDRLAAAGMADQAEDFFRASGAWVAELYRAEIEMAIRTPGMGGFQLLDLQDYSGQGTALVGILDAFMDSKGLITPTAWRHSCDRIVLLAELPKFCYSGEEMFHGTLAVANYSAEAIEGKTLSWQLTGPAGEAVAGDRLPLSIAQGTLGEAAQLAFRLPAIDRAGDYRLQLAIDGTDWSNSYPVWIYPKANEVRLPAGITIARTWDTQLEKQLAEGGRVLWFPDAKQCEQVTVGGLFQTDYWNYRMFKYISERLKRPVSPGTLGLLMDPEHPALKLFPTDTHTNWQWFEMTKQSRPLILDRLPKAYRPIIQVIDNVERNHKLGFLFEFRVGKGKLLVCMSDLEAQRAYPEARQLYNSLLAYMASDTFAPQTEMTAAEMRTLFTPVTEQAQIKALGNISYE